MAAAWQAQHPWGSGLDPRKRGVPIPKHTTYAEANWPLTMKQLSNQELILGRDINPHDGQAQGQLSMRTD